MRKKTVIISFLAVGFLIGLIFLAVFVRETPHTASDLAITRFIQSHRNDTLDFFFKSISWPGYPPHVNYFVPILIILVGLIGWYREAFFLFLATILVSGLGQLVKQWVDRPRPRLTEVEYIFHQGLEGWQRSFPAGHVQSYVAILGFLAIILFLKMKKGWFRRILISILIFMIVFIGISRVYLGEHWMSDIIGAYLLGFFVLIVTYLIYDKTKLIYGKTRNQV